ncbi:rifin [Plasmodium reichenowi]|uniref:Rifin n=1 Tax=Plasmodium reichenowi TaxID=5854 RepID=A0A060RRH2_PLARE|nr:rifin [Plasmodium reichenowi]
MKLHYTQILLFFLPLTILLTSTSYVHNKNKPYLTPQHTPIYTSRVLSECKIQSSSYDNDEEMKSVKEKFDRQTSQRFEEYDERMKDKRQKRKEQRDKNIQNIIDKDKMEKSLATKIEKYCLRCGCGLGGVAASVGLFGGLGTYGWKSAAIATATNAAMAEATAKGAEAGVKTLINKLKEAFPIPNLFDPSFEKAITTETYCNEALISGAVKQKYELLCAKGSSCENYSLFSHYRSGGEAEGARALVEGVKEIVGEAMGKASEETLKATESQMASLKSGKLAEISETSYSSYSAIGYSVLAILIIVLVMIIIYLVLRYRRKKKMIKKYQYTKLLNQ